MRLETIRKKRNAVQKFLKKDIADLLRNTLDYNAYGRAEGLFVEQNMSACYELIAMFVGCISGHVRDICKLKDCPDECKEAIPSLIYAAARFSDLPELRDLRTLFTEKFGNSLEPYISKEFIERLRQNPPSKEMKIQLLHELAQEFSIEWDRKALEQRLYSPPLLHEEKPKHDPQNDYGNVKCQKNNDDAWWRVQTSTDNETTTTDNSSQDGPKACSGSFENVYEDDEAEINKPFSSKVVPPPYVKENKVESNLKKPSETPQEKPIPRSVRRRPLKPPPEENTVKDFSKAGDDAKLDELLMHYIKKQSVPYESSGIEIKYDHKVENRRHTKSNSTSIGTISLRGKSLPQRNTSSMETLQGHGRATSLVPELSRTTTKNHVHPCLPDYDDLSARLAALRRT